ncbi:dTTP/UTP pyrophosphatase [Vibrio stylophorae]|uniref:dTTP/UTP pyrophosphatase n=1 Tax=Vibrio stylophorae TaxID=659351 RepID=A0ABN8DYL3_9VIBR|nr:Maf family protein [Vibrio stylophorae]CAH0534462.1 dTTP/UTP pyrophosphatase [Vibrio stylophorae]
MSFKLYLASQSPRRRELLAQLNVEFEVLSASIPEQKQPNESAAAYVQRLALEKAQAGLAVASKPWPVLGADTVVVVDDLVLEKPRDFSDFQRMMQLMSGRAHQVMTAVALVTPTQAWVHLETTQVWFSDLSAAQIESYWQSQEPCDKAGGYGIQGLAGQFIPRIEGCYYNVVGLPLHATAQLISKLEGETHEC